MRPKSDGDDDDDDHPHWTKLNFRFLFTPFLQAFPLSPTSMLRAALVVFFLFLFFRLCPALFTQHCIRGKGFKRSEVKFRPQLTVETPQDIKFDNGVGASGDDDGRRGQRRGKNGGVLRRCSKMF